MKKHKKIAIYPGSFDPVTNGHLGILERSKDVFDKVICAIGVNSNKNPMFNLEEKIDMLKHTVPKCVEVDYFSGLLVDYAKKIKGKEKVKYITILRGVRLTTDFEYELLMAFNNKKLEPSLEYLFLPTEQELLHVNSSIVRDISKFGPKYIKTLDVPKYVKQKLKEKYR
jgi:pantetheine-phosphate adenylyltransferase